MVQYVIKYQVPSTGLFNRVSPYDQKMAQT